MKKNTGQGGMSLLELMVALTIFALVLVGVVPVMVLAISYNREARRSIEARNALSSHSEYLKTLPMSDVFRQDDGDTNDLADNINPDHTFTDTVRQFVVNWNISMVSSFQQNVRIFVNWQDRRGLRRAMSTDINLIGD